MDGPCGGRCVCWLCLLVLVVKSPWVFKSTTCFSTASCFTGLILPVLPAMTTWFRMGLGSRHLTKIGCSSHISNVESYGDAAQSHTLDANNLRGLACQDKPSNQVCTFSLEAPIGIGEILKRQVGGMSLGTLSCGRSSEKAFLKSLLRNRRPLAIFESPPFMLRTIPRWPKFWPWHMSINSPLISQFLSGLLMLKAPTPPPRSSLWWLLEWPPTPHSMWKITVPFKRNDDELIRVYVEYNITIVNLGLVGFIAD